MHLMTEKLNQKINGRVLCSAVKSACIHKLVAHTQQKPTWAMFWSRMQQSEQTFGL